MSRFRTISKIREIFLDNNKGLLHNIIITHKSGPVDFEEPI